MQQLQLQTELQRLPIEQPMWEAATSLVSFAHSVLTLFNGIAAIWPIVSWLADSSMSAGDASHTK